jgi:hypothetical protein
MTQSEPERLTKRCPSCRNVKSREEFPKNRSSKDGLAAYCKPCHNRIIREQKERLYGGERNFLLRLRYGIDELAVATLMEEQGGLCAICRTKPAVHVDHDHRTGACRGLLCFACNRGLGKAEDNPETLRAMIEYLRKHAPGPP